MDFLLIAASILQAVQIAQTALPPPLDRFSWIIGRWQSTYDGLVHWPTIPTMRFVETIDIWPAQVSDDAAGVRYLNWTAVAISHNSDDHFHNEYAYLTALPNGEVKFFAIGNNGFGSKEKGTVHYGRLVVETEAVHRIIVARELPVEAVKREFRLLGRDTMEQILFMRTITHPHHDDKCNLTNTCPMREHARNLYQRIKKLDS